MTENFDNPTLDNGLINLAAQIDTLALDDQSRAGLEDRVFASTLAVLQKASAEAAPQLRLAGTPAAARRRTTIRLNTGMRLAAGLALLVTTGAVWLANRPPEVTKKPISASDDWAIVSNLFDDGAATELDELATDTAGLDDRMKSINVGDLMFEEGAM
jgi:hypothetical protein